MIKINSVKTVISNRRSYMYINFVFDGEEIKIQLGIQPVANERARMVLDVTQVPAELENKELLEKFLEFNATRFLASYKRRAFGDHFARILLGVDEYYSILKELGWSPNDNQIFVYHSMQEYGWFPTRLFPEVDNYILEQEQINNHE